MRGSVLVAGIVVLCVTLVGCGGASAPLAGVGPSANASRTEGAPPGLAPVGLQVVRYRGLAFDVPSDWPVYDLDADPGRCVSGDVHAVYLGHRHSNSQCPAQLSGRAAVQVEPLDATTAGRATQATVSSMLNGQEVRTDPHFAFNHLIVAVFPAQGVLATLTFAGDGSWVEYILHTFTDTPG